MEIPPELLRDPPPATLGWVATQFGPGATVTEVRRLRNAWAAAVHAVDVSTPSGTRHEVVLRRWARTDQATDVGVVENEAAALSVVAGTPGLITPRLVAHDPGAEFADVPALVMTRLDGTDDLAPADLDPYLDGLVAALHAVHAAPVGAGALGDYRPYGRADRIDPPPTTRCPDVWRRAFDVARRPVPAYSPVLCHRDFHPGNVLWRDGAVTGVVDWTSTCRGPAAADVAHCRQNLCLLFGLEVADEFARRYGAVDDLAWFDVVNTVGWTKPDVWRWHDAGRTDITAESIARAFDDFLTAAVERADAG